MASGNKTEKPSVYHVQVLDRVFRILDVLTESGSGIGLPEIADRLDLHKSTAHRLMMVLEANRFVERNPISGRYHLGSRLMELGLSAVSQLSVYEIALPHLRALVAETGETAHLAVLRDGQVVSLVSAESTQTLRTPVTVGSRTPAHCTSLGKSMLAFGTEEQVEAYLREQPLKSYTQKTITKVSRFKAELRLTRERGYAIDNEEREVGLRCIGAPIWNSSGDVIAAVSIAGPAFRISDEQIPTLSKAVVRTATRISTSMGYREMKRRAPQH